jgi:hypothetical protein
MAAGERIRKAFPTAHHWKQSDFNDLTKAGATSPIYGHKFQATGLACAAGQSSSFLLIVNLSVGSVNLSVGSAVQLRGQEVSADCVSQVGLAQVFSLSLPQTFLCQATRSEYIVVHGGSCRLDVLANPFFQEIGSIGHDYPS